MRNLQFAVCNLQCALVLLGALLASSAASAHTLNVFARVEGTTIRGKAYFRGGTPAQEVEVIARDPAGKELGRTKTDDRGEFSLLARVRCDHTLVVDTGDGHGGQYVVRAAELPATVGQVSNLPPNSTTPVSSTESPHEANAAASDTPTPAPSSPGETPIVSQIEELQRQVEALREQLDAHDQQVRIRDILGGIGYIVGLTGVAYYVLAMRHKRPAGRNGTPSTHG
jgi:nickel transport protein